MSASRGCGNTAFGVAGVIGGLSLILFGLLWHSPNVTRTTGVIVQSTPAVYGQTRRTITYDYVAYGVHHRGERFLRTATQYVGSFDAGSSFPVYFETDHPELSYAPFPPRIYPLIGTGAILVAVGIGLLIFGRAR